MAIQYPPKQRWREYLKQALNQMSDFLPTYLIYVILAAIIIVPLALMWFFRYWQKKDALGDVNSLVCLLVSLPKEATADPHAANEPVKDFKGLIAPTEQLISPSSTSFTATSWPKTVSAGLLSKSPAN